MFVLDVADFSSCGIIQEKEAKQGVLGADLLGDVDPSLCPSEPDQLQQSAVESASSTIKTTQAC